MGDKKNHRQDPEKNSQDNSCKYKQFIYALFASIKLSAASKRTGQTGSLHLQHNYNNKKNRNYNFENV